MRIDKGTINHGRTRLGFPAMMLMIILIQQIKSELLTKENCPIGCLSCQGDLETQSYLKKCLKCDVGYYEYLGSCHNCPYKCTVCDSDRTCLRCDKFYTQEAEECVFSWLDLLIRVFEALIVIGIGWACLATVKKYRKQQEKYELEMEIKKLSQGRKRKVSKGGSASKSGKRYKDKYGRKRKHMINVMEVDQSQDNIDMDKTTDQSGLDNLIIAEENEEDEEDQV